MQNSETVSALGGHRHNSVDQHLTREPEVWWEQAGTSGGLMPDKAGLWVHAKPQGIFQRHSAKGLLRAAMGKTHDWSLKWSDLLLILNQEKVWHDVMLVKVPRCMHLLVIPVFYSGEMWLENFRWTFSLFLFFFEFWLHIFQLKSSGENADADFKKIDKQHIHIFILTEVWSSWHHNSLEFLHAEVFFFFYSDSEEKNYFYFSWNTRISQRIEMLSYGKPKVFGVICETNLVVINFPW